MNYGNRSDQSVYFDNLVVGVVAGNIIEEDHYYSFGLKIAAISSRKLGDAGEGKLSNPYLYNDKEMLDEDAGLNWYDYGFRNYDPQIGRFMQLDPLTDDYPFLTPYQYASDDPITNIDVDGLEGCPSVSGMVGYVGNLGSAASASSTIFTGIAAISRITSITSISLNVIRITSFVAKTNSQQEIISEQNAGNAINGQLGTNGVNGNAGDKAHHGGTNAEVDNDDNKIPPIFWQELEYPEIEEIDYEYSQTEMGQWQTLPIDDPDYVFLVFHYEPNKSNSTQNGRDARRTAKKENQSNPNSDDFHMHEVPYKSTKEGGRNAIMRPASIVQNRNHGIELGIFYLTNKMGDNDVFLVPLKKRGGVKRPKPIVVPQIKTQPKYDPLKNYRIKPPPTPIPFWIRLIEWAEEPAAG